MASYGGITRARRLRHAVNLLTDVLDDLQHALAPSPTTYTMLREVDILRAELIREIRAERESVR